MAEYKILWFDDEPSNISLIEKDLLQFVKKTYNRDLVISRHTTYSDDEGFLGIIRDPDVCMFISDLNLLGGTKGDKLVELIRGQQIFLDVLLYSSNHKQLLEATQFLDGIYRHALEPAKLNELSIKIKDVVNQNLWKENYAIRRHELTKS